MSDLLIIPNEYKYEVVKLTKKQFTTLKELMNNIEIDTVINACDADWFIGMNISMLYFCLYKQNYNTGRVQIPSLAIIAQRDYEIENFKKENITRWTKT